MTLAGWWKNTTPAMISKTLRTAVGFCRPKLEFETKCVYSHYIRATGAMALLFSGLDSAIINLIGCWRSNKMLSYLQLQGEPLMRIFLRIMLTHGHYFFLPHQEEVTCF